MLFDFHKTENEKKPNSVSATYLISGVQTPQKIPAANGVSNEGEDTVMRSSPYMSSMPQSDEKERSMRTMSFVLAREEDLDGKFPCRHRKIEVKHEFADAKTTFESISIIHIYSLQSNALPDLNALVDVSREILASFGNEDPLELGKQWGMIQNQNVKRRKIGKPPLPVVAPAPPKVEAPKKDVPKKEVAQPKAEPEVSSRESSQQKAQTKATEKAPARRKGDLFSSFANAKPKLKKEDSAASSVKSVSTLEVS
jgi:DNA polymerase delta subunit 3